MIPGRATPEGTKALVKKRADLDPGHWRSALGLTLSSIGMGTYLGNADPVTDAKYQAAVLQALGSGINVLDSAINYRYQRSERNIGQALSQALESGSVAREEVLLCTKGGFIAGDMGPPTREWFETSLLKPGVMSPEDLVAGCHCMTPAYLRHEVDESRKNLGVETIDVYYVHNPETQLGAVVPDEYYLRLTAAFRALEECVAQGKIQWYGTATWHAYRIPPGTEVHVSLERTVQCAAQAGGTDHHFRVVQFPFNIGMPEAYTALTQPLGGQDRTALEAAGALGLTVFTSVPLMQGQILGRLNRDIKERLGGLKTDAQRCLQFARSAPGITAPLCGMKDTDHVLENTKVATVPALSPEAFRALFSPAAPPRNG
jgi:aryl-alcohol dehydrogenase-like predicted oxidoreductase